MKYPCVRQHSQEDCGAACLGTIAHYHGQQFTLSRLRELVGTGQQGTTLLGLKRGAEALGLQARAVTAHPAILDRLEEVSLPAIIHWKGVHWVVLHGKKGNRYVIADPGVGLRFVDQQTLREGWRNWVMLLLEPDPAQFYAQTDDHDRIGGFSRFLKRVLSYGGILSQALLFNAILGLLALASPFLVQILTDDVLVRGDTQLLTRVVMAVGVMQLISSSLRLIQANLIAHFSQRLQLGLGLEFGRQILRLPLTYYESRRSGEVTSRLEDIQVINQLVAQAVVQLPSQLFIALVSLGFMMFYNAMLTGVALAIAIVMTVSTVVFLPTFQQQVRNLLVLSSENQGVLVETFKGALTLKTTAAAPQFADELHTRFSRLARLRLSTLQIVIINGTFSNLVANLGNIGLLWAGSRLVIQQELTIGMLLAFITMNRHFTTFISTAIEFVDEFARARTATQRLTEAIDAVPEIAKDAATVWANLPADGEIQCHQLSFHHAGRIDLLQTFSLTLPGGKTTALIGKSGCGKSTLVKLIAGLYTPLSGNIRFGAYNQQDLALDCLRQQVVLVPQEPHFWSRSIVENFRLGNPHIGFEQIVHACQIAGADEFISQLPDKYRTVLGEFGSNLSGGQRQRLAIARALVNDPPVLILDESTAALDPVSETEILDALLHHRRGKTTLLISHRPRVIQRADWLVLLNNGQIQQQGSPEALRHQSGDHLPFLVA
ncbi:MAG: peptidase domain-containing ABC transporter [Leptolyngbya sp. SIO1D8]|nr:peptidase domain-containing ABC transporter [Leptolyngbya sp. SIO1D8]